MLREKTPRQNPADTPVPQRHATVRKYMAVAPFSRPHAKLGG